MGLALSVVISYAGLHEAVECIKHIINGYVPDSEPDFHDLVEYYSKLLAKSAHSTGDWSGQGYLQLTEDANGKLRTVAVKYYNEAADSTAILFSTKISSFGQDSVEEVTRNGNYKSEKYSPKTKTLVTNSSESFSVGYRNKSPSPLRSIPNAEQPSSAESTQVEHNNETSDGKDKMVWHYQPLGSTETPEIHFQSYDEDKKTYSDDFLRSLDGIKYRPLQRSDPSGRRRSFRKRHSSSSNSSKDSRASREEELKIFTSLEEAEFGRMTRDDKYDGFGSAPNLSARSNSRSRSRERRHENWSAEAPTNSVAEESRVKDTKLDSFEEETNDTKEVTEEEEEEVDFWGTIGD